MLPSNETEYADKMEFQLLRSEPDPRAKEAACKEEIGVAICCLSCLEGRVKGESEY